MQRLIEQFETMDFELCPVCGKRVYFTIGSYNRTNYVYKRRIRGKTLYYCGWNHFNQGR